MKEGSIVLSNSDLSSRSVGAQFRQKLVDATVNGAVACVDLSKVKSISPSFADEAFAVIAEFKGVEWFVRHIEFQGAEEPILRSIASAIHERQKRGALQAA